MSNHKHRTSGKVGSDLDRQLSIERNGVPLLRVSNDAAQVTLDIVNALRDGEGVDWLRPITRLSVHRPVCSGAVPSGCSKRMTNRVGSRDKPGHDGV